MDTRWPLFAVMWLAGVNLATWIAFAVDKRAAVQKASRVRERTLLTLALIGGSPAAIAARTLLRHKTRKQPFSTLLMLIVLVQGLATTAILAWRVGWIG